MAQIVLGMGTSHGPMLSTPPEQWDLRVPFDLQAQHPFRGKNWSYNELVELRKDENLEAQITLEKWRQRHAACRAAIDEMGRVLEEVKPDITVIVGNDQMEVFSEDLIPTFGVLWGESIVNSMYSDERMSQLPVGVPVSVPGHIPPEGAEYPGQPDLALHLIKSFMANNIDVASMKRMPGNETPHAYGFVYRQLMKDRPMPTVPVFVNTFYPPNQPSVNRCCDLGRVLVRAIQSWESDARVAILCSGGLTHFVIDEELDRAFFKAMADRDIDSMSRFDDSWFQAGTSELKNWIPVAAGMAELGFKETLVDYVPCYRTPAGTGNAMGFVHWLP